jgi:hypothetical protein
MGELSLFRYGPKDAAELQPHSSALEKSLQ